jgi:predicted transcriptional regulator of viral defense system
MRFLEFRQALQNFTIFSLADIYSVDPEFHRRRLNNWQEKGYIRKVIRGYYIFTDVELDEFALFTLANKIYDPSYVSFESALSYYHLIPESVYGITSASTLVTRAFKTSLANFKYHSLKPGLFFGYELINHNGKFGKIACREKAILDYFYIHPDIKSSDDFAKLRFNAELFLKEGDQDKLRALAERMGQKQLLRRINNFMEYLQHA